MMHLGELVRFEWDRKKQKCISKASWEEVERIAGTEGEWVERRGREEGK